MELKYKIKTTKMHKKITEDVIELEHKDNGEKANIIFNSLLHTKCQNKYDNTYVEEKECVDIEFNGRINNDDGHEIDIKTSNF